jgi:transposase InsO family protein
MPWKETTAVSERLELVELAVSDGGANLALLCRRFGVSRKTAYKWLERYRAGGAAALGDRSRRPAASPARTAAHVEARVVELRHAHPAWGGRKIAARLKALGEAGVPAPSTVTRILRDHGLLDPGLSAQHEPWRRFEHPAPNDLWQMDFKGHVPLGRGGRCHPLTVLDDHSRYSLVLVACGGESGEVVRQHLVPAFRRYGLPRRVLADNGAPWGNCGKGRAVDAWSRFGVWLLRLGVAVAHGRPGHPQTQGKEERFHRTLAAEVLRWRTFADLAEAQPALDAWRRVYNHERPHEALGLRVPAARYAPSPRPYPEALPPVEYGSGDVVRRVRTDGRIKLGGLMVPVGTAFTGEPVALRPTRDDGLWDVYYCACRIGQVDRRDAAPTLRPPRPLAPLAGAGAGGEPDAPPMCPNTCNP